jgi:type II secretory pathway pseudopilin PulG
MKTRFHTRGVTLVELIAFVVIVGVLVSGLIGGFSATMRGSGTPKQMTQALQYAQERMELIRAQKDRLGFSGFTAATFDPCLTGSTHPACTSIPGYTVTVSPLDVTGACMGNDANYKCITVTVTDATTSAQLAQLISAVANY